MNKFKVGDIVKWLGDSSSFNCGAIGTVTATSSQIARYGIEGTTHTEYLARVNWNIYNPKGYSHCNVSQNDLELFKFQIGDICKVKPLSNWVDLPIKEFKISDHLYKRTDFPNQTILAVFEYLGATHSFRLDNLKKVEENKMEDTVKRLEERLAEATKEAETLRKQLEEAKKPKIPFVGINGIFLAKYKEFKSNTFKLLVKCGTSSGPHIKVLCVDSSGCVTHSDESYFASDRYEILKKLESEDLEVLFND